MARGHARGAVVDHLRVLVYSLSMGLGEFAAHGYRRLAELESIGR
jgi:hypothetical protein